MLECFVPEICQILVNFNLQVSIGQRIPYRHPTILLSQTIWSEYFKTSYSRSQCLSKKKCYKLNTTRQADSWKFFFVSPETKFTNQKQSRESTTFI